MNVEIIVLYFVGLIVLERVSKKLITVVHILTSIPLGLYIIMLWLILIFGALAVYIT